MGVWQAGNSTATKPISVRSLIDTNVLVYADAADDPVRQRRALDVIMALRARGSAVLATQVLQEYVNVALRKLRLPPPLVRERLAFYRRFEVVPTSPDLIAGALDLHALHGLAFYDALIVQAAAASGCERLLTEDMQPGATLAGVRIENPFTTP
ncbi:MAG: PIN domain-containing protein [Burkholderiales bacterium]|nr:PIN domain-containing protein [Burkholderiales bacterium]